MEEKCKYCHKPILPDEEIKTFKKKTKRVHLYCYENRDSKLIKVTAFIITLLLGSPVDADVYSKNHVSYEQLINTEDGFCPVCQQAIEKDDVLKIFRSDKRKPWHLNCWKKKIRIFWWVIGILLTITIGAIIGLTVYLVCK